MKRLILHVGVPKAGSTSLQRFLALHREDLAAANILYPNAWDYSDDWVDLLVRSVKMRLCRAGMGFPNYLSKRPQNHNNLYYQHAMKGRDKHLFSATRMTFEKLQRIIARCAEDTIIVSSESLADAAGSPERLAPFVELVEATGVETEIVFFVRPQHLIVNSVYSQTTKELHSHLDFRAFFDIYAKGGRKHFADKLAGWSELPRSKLTALPLAKGRLSPNLEMAFFAAVGLEDRVRTLLDASSSRIRNISPGPKTLETCRRACELLGNDLNVVIAGSNLRKRFALGKEILVRGDQLGWNRVKFFGLDNDMREQLLVKNAAKNEEIAQQFWGESWDNVFADDYSCDLVPNAVRYSTCSTQGQREIDQVLQDAMRKVGLDPDSFAQGRDPNRVS